MSQINGVELIPCPICGCTEQYYMLNEMDMLDGFHIMQVIRCDNHKEYVENGINHYKCLCIADTEGFTFDEAIEKWNKGLAE